MFFNDIQEFGWKNIKHEILYEGKTAKEAQRIEKELILKYQSERPYFFNRSHNIFIYIL